MKRFFLILLLLFVLCLPLLAEENDREDISYEPSTVYFTQEISPDGIKKIYKQLAPSFPGTAQIFEYTPDSFLSNADNSILATRPTDEALQRDLPPEFADAISSETNQRYTFPRLKNSPVSQWHYFRFLPCLCYDEQYRDSLQDRQCQAQSWYPSWDCRQALKWIHNYEKQVQSPKTLVVLSKAKIYDVNSFGAAFENIMGGNAFLLTISTDKIGHLHPFLETWAERLANPQKHTLFITVLADIPDTDGNLHSLGVIGSTNFWALQQETFKLLNRVNPVLAEIHSDPLPADPSSHEVKGSETFYKIIGVKLQEGPVREIKSPQKQRKILKRLLQERAAEAYKVVSLDK
ncbi:MAG: hypothetical protein J5601_05375 [Elusimicrobiaceae bacterium]|nr:hypothetical protein [Elusimicrobiaceae bacterium]